tara:strand:- start:29 stop:337 length:309 start_codon:yes stop_codon:yes gene_type:complete
MKKYVVSLLLLLLLNACGTAPAWLATSTGAYSEYKVVAYAKTSTDLALSAADLPTTNDFVLSRITGYDCKVSRLLDEKKLEAVCKNIKVHPPENGVDKEKTK